MVPEDQLTVSAVRFPSPVRVPVPDRVRLLTLALSARLTVPEEI